MSEQGEKSWLTIGTLLLATTLVALSGGIVNPILPAIENAFPNVPNAGTLAQLVSTLTGLIIAIFAPIIGVLVDRYGRKSILVGSIIIYGIGPSLAYFLDSLYLILATRVFLGIAVAGIMVSSTTLIADYFSGKRRETVMGWQGAMMPFGAAVAMVAGGVIADLNWRTAFLTYLVAFLMLPLVVRYIDEPDIDTNGEETSLPSLTEVREILSGLPLAFLAGVYLTMFIGMIGYNQINVEIPFYLQTVTSVSGTMTGIAIAAVSVAAGLVSLNFDRIRERLHPVAIIACIFAAAGVGFLIAGLTGSYWIIVVGIIIAGAGLILLTPTMNYWVASRITEQYRGRALSGVTTTQFLGMFMSPIAAQPLISSLGNGQALVAMGGLGFGLMVLFAVMALRGRSVSDTASPPQPND
ncbi:MFS transporter [Halopiger xanaduensis]|uniref:Major facilitator superfamily MFS_1 n=1 Tax=Halopiger xanaduensis (strain DSM 18323 / JCM 14033 / SH-6) TaxID=797210 RepID=F8DDY8_HALXS|nr:MFS transporter [Halopiger xanaduensis]AEH39244.1 major facilitator superfamily MFS_1 [Halopiger xanaduensis SH-6]